VRHRGRTADETIARLATRAHGVVTRRGLLTAGITAAEIRVRLDRGALIPQYAGVYRVGHWAHSLEAEYLAAVYACGDGASLFGLAAAHLYGLVRARPTRPEVLTPTERRVARIRTVRVRRLDPRDVAVHRGVPVTTVPRTIVDLGARLRPADLARAVHEAAVRYCVTPEHIEAVLARRANSPGAARLRRVLRGDFRVTLRQARGPVPRAARRRGTSLPETNRRVEEHYVDCRWREPPLTVELDSYRYHSSRHAWEADRRRERAARGRGDEFRRYTWHDVYEEPKPMLAELGALLLVRRRVSSPSRREALQ
jgi:hypothetical protein